MSNGNDISPRGNAKKFLAEYFAPPGELDLSVPCGQMKYTSRLDEVDCVSINPNGDLTVCGLPIGNIGEEDVLTILDRYDPYENPAKKALLEGGVEELVRYAKGLGVEVDMSECYSACDVCQKIFTML